MTLSRFLRDYLYVSLGGNRKGSIRRYLNLLITMVLGGLWHGAGWTFVLWGALHGAYLIVNHAWHAAIKALGRDPSRRTPMEKFIGTGLTFIAVMIAWVVFRAPDVRTASTILRTMAGLDFLSPKSAYWYVVASVNQIGPADVSELAWLGTALVLVWLTPNTWDLMRRFYPGSGNASDSARLSAGVMCQVAWTPSRLWAVFVGGLLAISLLSMTRVSEFLYFQF